jgi:site-specific DNA-methyltransferase (adenine-specific)
MTAVLEDNSVDCCFTSPPYFQLRDYQIGETQLGQEASVKKFITNMMNTFNDVYRVLKPTGSLFLNIDDTVIDGNMCGVPEALVLEMKKNGWVLNDRIIWYKSNPLYQICNRTQPSMEFIYHFVKNTKFYYDKSWVQGATFINNKMTLGSGENIRLRNVFNFDGKMVMASTANTAYIQKKVAHTGLEVTHTATFPREIPLIGILSATKPGDTVLDCFNGLATTGEVALELGRNYIGFDLNEEYLAVSKARLDVTLEEIKNQTSDHQDNNLRLVA